MSGEEHVFSPEGSSPALNGTRRQLSSFAIQVTSVASNSSLTSMGLASSPSPRLKRKATILTTGRSFFVKRRSHHIMLARPFISRTVRVLKRTVSMLDAECNLTPELACGVLGLAAEALHPPLSYAALYQARAEVRRLKEEAAMLREERQLLIEEVNELQRDVFTLEDDRDAIEAELGALRDAANACVRPQSSNNLNASSASTPEAFEWANAINKSLSKSKDGSFSCPEKCPHCGEPMTFSNKWCAVTGQRHRSEAEKELDVLRRRLSAIARDELSRGFIADGSVVYHSDGDTPETSPRRRSRNWRDSPLSFSQYSQDSRRPTDASLFDMDDDAMSDSRRRRQSLASEGTPPVRLLRKPRGAFSRGFGSREHNNSQVLDEHQTPPLGCSTPPLRPAVHRVGTLAQGDVQKYGLTSAPTVPRIVHQHGSSSSLQSPTSPLTPAPHSGLRREPTLPTSMLEAQLSDRSFPRVRSTGGRSSFSDSPTKQPVLRKSTMPMRVDPDLHVEEVRTIETISDHSDSSSVASDATLQQSEEHTRALDPSMHQ